MNHAELHHDGSADAPTNGASTSAGHAEGLTRREALQAGGILGLAGGLGLIGSLPQTAQAAAVRVRGRQQEGIDMPPAGRDGRPRNIIFMVSDGMSAAIPGLAETFARRVHGETHRTQWWRLSRTRGVTFGQFDMASLNSPVTDSAAASSSWGSGSRVFNGAINMLPDGTSLVTLAELAKSTRRAVGLVTTTQITHATPAGFATAVPSRSQHADIARQYLDRVDVLLGGGVEYFDGNLRSDGLDLLGKYRQHGYVVCASRSDLLAVQPERGRGDRLTRVLGAFSRDHLPYTIDHRHSPTLSQTVPTLAEMTRAALVHLGDHPDGFLLQVEAGRVDHAAHANDAAGILWDQLAFDDAIAVVLEYVRTHPDTLVVVTTDHGNANPGLNGMGDNYERSGQCFERLLAATASTSELWDRLRARAKRAGQPVANVDDIREVVRAGTGLEISAEDAADIAVCCGGSAPTEINRQHRNFEGILGQITGNFTGVQWTGVSHTADWCPILALGPGQERFAGLVRNTEAFAHLAVLMDVDYRNPEMSESAAQRYADRTGPDASGPAFTMSDMDGRPLDLAATV